MKLLFPLILLMSSDVVLADEISPTLIGGRYATEGQFPEVVYISAGRSRCSATIIGPRTILTAGHCVADDGEIRPAEFVVNQEVYVAKCKQAPQYRDNTEDLDLALCKTDKDLSGKFASIASAGPELEEQVTLSGYGCVREGGGGGNDGRLKYGESKVIQLPNGTNNWFYTQHDSALCYGDSGGPSFKHLADPKSEHHYVIGVNSRGNIRDLSLLAAVYIEKSQKFFKDFERDHDVKICGISLSCDGEGGQEEPEPKPNPKCKRYEKKVKYYNRKLNKAKRKLEQCQNRDTSELLRLPFKE